MKTERFPSITLRVDLLSNETSLPKGAVREAVNVDIDRVGNFSRRPGYTRVVAQSGFHSIKTLPQSGLVLVAQGSVLKQLNPDNYSLSTVFTLNSPDPVDYTEHDGNLYFSNATTIGWLPKGGAALRTLGVPTPPAPAAAASGDGSLLPGRRMVAVTTLDDLGEESGSSEYVSVDVASGGGFSLSNLPTSGTRVRIYMTPPDGEVLFLTKELPSGNSSTTVTEDLQLKQLDTAALVPMTPGRFVRGYNGRLYTAKDKVLSFSEPLRFGLTFPGHNYIQFNDTITFIEPVVNGIYVGAGPRVWFLAGDDPKKFQQTPVSHHRAMSGSSLLVPPEYFPDKMIQSSYPVAIWLSTAGYFAGLPGGDIVSMQPDRVRIAASVGRSAMLVREGRKQVVTPVNSISTAASGTALDSTV